MEYVGCDGDDTERARKRHRPGEAFLGTTESFNRLHTEEVVDDPVNDRLFSHLQTGNERGHTPKVYHGDTTVTGNATLVQGDIIHNHYHSPGLRLNKYDILLESLTFDRMGARLRNVAMPFVNTCKWVFEDKHFCQWIDESNIGKHHGFLWIKGKPGSGKSTIMKEIVAWAQSTWSSQIVLTYFFNARSPHHLEKSTLGLYQSLLYQLLSVFPGGHQLFANRFASKIRVGNRVEEWSHVELQNFLVELMTRTCHPNVNIFIDALDEGDTDDIRRMVTFLEQLTQASYSESGLTRVCLSSRHYPYINIRKGLSFVLENQLSHTDDIDRYVRNELAGHNSSQIEKLQAEIRNRSAGVFLWVVLVIPILNRGFDSGKSVAAMRQELLRIPQDLHNMFVELLSRDAENMNECIAVLRWVLYSQRSLSLLETYDAVKQACSIADIREGSDLHDDTLVKYLLHCSRGLIEAVEDKADWHSWISQCEPRKIVQFIHETAREFLLGQTKSDGALGVTGTRLGSAMDFRADACHMLMAKECMRYLLRLSERTSWTKDLLEQHPLADYAAQNWHVHLHACSKQATQEMSNLAFKILVGGHDRTLLRTLEIHGLNDRDPTLDDKTPLVHRAVHIGIPRLVFTFCSQVPKVDTDYSFGLALILAADLNLKDVLQVFLDHGCDIDVRNYKEETALYRAADQGHEEIVQMLLEHGAGTNIEIRPGETALSVAIDRGHEAILQRLVEYGGNIDALDGRGYTALHRAVYENSEEKVRLLLKLGANVNFRADNGIVVPSRNGLKALSPLQLDVHVASRDDVGKTPVSLAASMEHTKVMEMLLKNGSDVNTHDGRGMTALCYALSKRNEGMVNLLLKYGADVNTKCDGSHTPLLLAVIEDQTTIVQLLLDHRADPNQAVGLQNTPLLAAVANGCQKAVKLLLKYGASVHRPYVRAVFVPDVSARSSSTNKSHYLKRQWVVRTIVEENKEFRPFEALRERISQILIDHGAPETFSDEVKRHVLQEHHNLLAGRKNRTEQDMSHFQLPGN